MTLPTFESLLDEISTDRPGWYLYSLGVERPSDPRQHWVATLRLEDGANSKLARGIGLTPIEAISVAIDKTILPEDEERPTFTIDTSKPSARSLLTNLLPKVTIPRKI